MDNAEPILAILQKAYPHTGHYLRFSNPLELLVATILSAQVRDEVVNSRTPGLFRTYKSARDYAQANLEELEQLIKPITFYRNKARSVQAACALLVKKHGGRVPDSMDDLLELPGVARKTANAVLQNAFNIVDGIVVDTHVIRLSQRLGWTREKDPVKIERDLMTLPRKWWPLLPHLLKSHGRAVCKAPTPACSRCIVADLCPKIGVTTRE